MVDIEEIIRRVKGIKGFLTDKEFASLLGLSAADFSNRKKRETLLPLIISWAVTENVDIDRLVRVEETRRGGIRSKNDGQEDGEYEANDIYDLKSSQSPGDWSSYRHFKKVIISRQYGEGRILLRMSGATMEPTILDGAIIAVDCKDTRFTSGKIYVLWIPSEGPIIRRVFVDLEKVTLKADNPHFPDISIRLKDVPKEKFNLGSVDWVLQSL